jgi:hypothetical protein
LQDERDAFDGGSVRAFPALRQALFHEFLRVRQQANALARRALAAKIIRKFFAIGRFREHAREREFADTPRACEKERVRDSFAAERAAQRSDDTFIAEKFGETHGLTALH